MSLFKINVDTNSEEFKQYVIAEVEKFAELHLRSLIHHGSERAIKAFIAMQMNRLFSEDLIKEKISELADGLVEQKVLALLDKELKKLNAKTARDMEKNL